MKGNSLRQAVAVSALLLAVLFLVPLAGVLEGREEAAAAKRAAEAPLPPFESGALDGEVSLRVLGEGGTVTEMDLGTYLVGVVQAEMPASFHPEALKAQAAAARTYTLYKLRTGGNHGDTADVCTDPTCCQSYMTEEAARASWGEDAHTYGEKIRQAVRDTDGQAVLYDGAPILAVFHSSSAGLTQRAGQVWQGDLPYLQPVTSPEQGDAIPNYYSRVEFTLEDLRARLQEAWPDADLTGPASGWLGDLEADSGGTVSRLTVGGVEARGARLRTVLGLRSACFTWEVEGDKAVFYVTGYGHGVGLSQYGANQMASEGADYREILTHYYTGVTVGPYHLD